MALLTDLIEKDEKKRIYLDPKLIVTESQLDKTLAELKYFSESYNCEAVVALTDNRQLGPCYFITSKDVAVKEIRNKKQPEKWVKYYTYSDYERLRERLN